MNKRIKELANQANDLTCDNKNSGRVYDAFVENLTGLIVQECVKVCLEQRDPQNLNYKPSEKFADAIKQHFGIR